MPANQTVCARVGICGLGLVDEGRDVVQRRPSAHAQCAIVQHFRGCEAWFGMRVHRVLGRAYSMLFAVSRRATYYDCAAVSSNIHINIMVGQARYV